MLQAIIETITGEKEFSKENQSRHTKFWKTPDAE